MQQTKTILIIGGDNGGGSAGDELMCEAACAFFRKEVLRFILMLNIYHGDLQLMKLLLLCSCGKIAIEINLNVF